MSEVTRWKQRFDNYRCALQQLTQAVNLMVLRPHSDLEKHGLIHEFEFTHELSWKILKDYLEYEGIKGLIGSRSTVREAFSQGLITDGEAWLDMIEKRNLSSHTYNLDLVPDLIDTICNTYHPAFLTLQERMEPELSICRNLDFQKKT